MTQSSKGSTDRGRRLLLGTGGAALALGATGRAHAGSRPTTPTYAISRTRYTTSASAFLPTAGDTYVVPLSQVVSTDNTDSTLHANNTITINHAGNYRIMLAVDWSSGKGHDGALRSSGIRLRPAGRPPIVAAPGGMVTLIADTDQHLATQDLPGALTPQTVRLPEPIIGSQSIFTPFPWTPGTIAAGSFKSVDVTMPIVNIVAAGDVALASHSAITDAVLGAGVVAALIVSARPIAQDVVRVTIVNPLSTPVTIPTGDLQVLCMSATLLTGGSSEARTVMSSVTLPLRPGDTIYTVFRSLMPGDVLQASSEMYVEVERFTQTS
jgi:hypothetical protein